MTISAGERAVTAVTRRNGLQAQVLQAVGIDTSGWAKATVSPAA